MANRLLANTGQITFDSNTFFGVELEVPTGQTYAAGSVVYAFTEADLLSLCDLIRFSRTRGLTNETTETTFTDSA